MAAPYTHTPECDSKAKRKCGGASLAAARAVRLERNNNRRAAPLCWARSYWQYAWPVQQLVALRRRCAAARCPSPTLSGACSPPARAQAAIFSLSALLQAKNELFRLQYLLTRVCPLAGTVPPPLLSVAFVDFCYFVSCCVRPLQQPLAVGVSNLVPNFLIKFSLII